MNEILNVYVHEGWRYAQAQEEMDAIVSAAMETMRPERDIAGPTFSDRRLTGHSTGDNYLRLAINRETGFGGLVWFVTRSSSRKGGIFDHVWVSDNPEPPDFDPKVVTDPWVPVYLDRRSALPIPRIRAAVDEFCRVGTGDRPESIEWVHGWMNGTRLDAE